MSQDKVVLSVRLDPQSSKELAELEKILSSTKSDVIRIAIQTLYLKFHPSNISDR